ncbi:MAG: amidohydrolase family protein [Terracidiphilus sp.]
MTEREIVFINANVFDGSGREPFRGTVHVRANRIVKVSDGPRPMDHSPEATVVDCGGGTLMPGLIEPHGHLSFTNGRAVEFTFMPVEETMMATMHHAKLALDCGYTSVFSAASAKPRIDVVLKREIESGRIPGPRYLACSPELTVTGGLGDTNQMHLPHNPGTTFSWVVDGKDEILRACRMFAREGVDTLKVHLSGDLGASSAPSEQTPFSDEELAAVVEVARSRELRIVCHARSATSVVRALRYGIKIINHANYIDSEALEALERAKDSVVVIPAIGVTHSFAYADGRWNIPPSLSRKFQTELEATISSVEKMRKRGIRVLPGGDYGFVCTPHGDYARDLWLFVEVLGFTPLETLVAATRHAAVVMGMYDEIGVIKENALADLLLIDGDPLDDISILQDRAKLLMIMKDGELHKAPPSSRLR